MTTRRDDSWVGTGCDNSVDGTRLRKRKLEPECIGLNLNDVGQATTKLRTSNWDGRRDKSVALGSVFGEKSSRKKGTGHNFWMIGGKGEREFGSDDNGPRPQPTPMGAVRKKIKMIYHTGTPEGIDSGQGGDN